MVDKIQVLDKMRESQVRILKLKDTNHEIYEEITSHVKEIKRLTDDNIEKSKCLQEKITHVTLLECENKNLGDSVRILKSISEKKKEMVDAEKNKLKQLQENSRSELISYCDSAQSFLEMYGLLSDFRFCHTKPNLKIEIDELKKQKMSLESELGTIQTSVYRLELNNKDLETFLQSQEEQLSWFVETLNQLHKSYEDVVGRIEEVRSKNRFKVHVTDVIPKYCSLIPTNLKYNYGNMTTGAKSVLGKRSGEMTNDDDSSRSRKILQSSSQTKSNNVGRSVDKSFNLNDIRAKLSRTQNPVQTDKTDEVQKFKSKVTKFVPKKPQFSNMASHQTF